MSLICPKCSHKIDKQDLMCPHCNELITDEKLGGDGEICQVCGLENPSGALSCSFCCSIISEN